MNNTSSIDRLALLHPEAMLFWGLLLVHVLLPWMHPFFPTQDGMSHLENAGIIKELSNPARPLLAEYYRLNTSPLANWPSHLFLAGAMEMFSPATAEKLLITFYLLLFPLAFRSLIAELAPDRRAFSVLIFPFVYSLVLHSGFYNFILSLPFFFALIALWLKHADNFTWKRAFQLSLLALLVSIFHLMTFLAAALALTMLLAHSYFSSQHSSNYRMGLLLRFAAGLAPAFLLILFFLSERHGGLLYGPHLCERLIYLINLGVLVTLGHLTPYFTAALFICLFTASVWMLVIERHQRQTGWEGFPLAALSFLALYLICPRAYAGGDFILDRLLLFLCILIIIWIALYLENSFFGILLRVASVGCSIALLVIHGSYYRTINNLYEDYFSVIPALESNTTLLPLCFSPLGHKADGSRIDSRVLAFLHAPGYLALSRNLLNLDNYEPGTTHFPIIHKPNSPIPSLLRFGELKHRGKPDIDFLSVPTDANFRIDYVLLWGRRYADSSLESYQNIMRQLDEEYVRVFVSKNRGYLELFKKR